ncbi:hypothetical protein LSTR_LSTR008396 [Laodelphax striatellus]|uniref:RRM domain-containing protein n=1 Tax=Laodelphax striatellus TaxID=195883 RepID=A0A482XV63_LAOST|nr:hypothetical protein LSTR_LSTR008396 [Laodelphax striatellus]
MSTYMQPKRKSAKSNSEPSSNGSSPPASVNLTNGNNMNQVANNNNLNAANNNNNAPKYGTLVPNRVFVGGISSTTTETELCQLFSKYGNVKATKIIADRAGVSKGYGFVTFETDEEAKRLQLDADNIILKERRLNIAPAIIKQGPQIRYERKNRKNKKIIISIEETMEGNENNQAFPPRVFEANSPPPMLPPVYYHNGIPYTFQNGTAFFQPPQLQAPPLPAAPDAAAMYPGAGYGPAQGPSQPQAQLMYPYANPAPMFLPQYHQYAPVQMNQQQHQQLMYSTPIQTATNGTDTPPPMSMSPHANAPYYVQGVSDMRPEMYYMPPSPGQPYPYPTPMLLTSVGPEPGIHYCEIATDQQQGSNAPTEVLPPQPIAEENGSQPIVTSQEPNIVQPQEQSDAPPNSDAANEEEKNLAITETPIVSAKNLQKIDESENNRDVRYRGNRQGGHGRYSDVQNNAPHGDYNERGNWKRNRGGRNMNHIPKYPFNNNTSITNYNKGEGGHVNRGGYRGGHGNGGGRGNYRMNQQNGAGGRRVVHRSSTPPTESYSFPPPNKPLHSNQFQVNQQAFMAGRNVQQASFPHAVVAAASAAQLYNGPPPPPPPPPANHHQANVPPRRFNTIAPSQRRNYQSNNHHSSRKRGEIDNGGAGDGPLHHETASSASKASPPPTATTEQDIISGVKNLTVQ